MWSVHSGVFLYPENEERILSLTLAFSACFHLFRQMRFCLKSSIYFMIRFCLPSSQKRPKSLTKMAVYDVFFRSVFKSPRFQLSTLKKEGFQTMRFKWLNYWNRFRKSSFSSAFLVVLVCVFLSMYSIVGKLIYLPSSPISKMFHQLIHFTSFFRIEFFTLPKQKGSI